MKADLPDEIESEDRSRGCGPGGPPGGGTGRLCPFPLFSSFLSFIVSSACYSEGEESEDSDPSGSGSRGRFNVRGVRVTGVVVYLSWSLLGASRARILFVLLSVNF